MLSIEFADSKTKKCECCDGNTTTLTRFVHEGEGTRAAYLAVFADNHSERVVTMVISIGLWGEQARPEDRAAFTVKLWVADDRFQVAVCDAAESPWQDAPILGRMLDRDEALAHSSVREVFHITDHIVVEDRPIISYLTPPSA